jgi:hypothetical protein
VIDALFGKAPKDCDECIQFVSDIEANLAANGTASDLEQALVLGCDRRFSDPAEAAQCRQTVVGKTGLPTLIDSLLAKFPPETACLVLNACPLESK